MEVLNCVPRVVYSHIGGLGEAPIWCAERHRLLQKDKNSIVSIDLSSGEAGILELEHEPGTIALTEDGQFIAACGNTVYLIENDGKIMPMHPPTHILAKQFNDGKVGPDGKFYVGTIYGDAEDGGLYCLDSEGRLTLMYAGLSLSNGMDWSSDGKFMFLADTGKQRILRFDFDQKQGFLQNGSVLCEIEGPDGLCIDAEDKIWCALCGSGRVVRIDPADGEIISEVRLPVLEVTSCTFVGDDLSLLVVTTASFAYLIGSSPASPQAGVTFVMDVGVHGRLPYRFK